MSDGEKPASAAETVDQVIAMSGDPSYLPPEQRQEDGKPKPAPRERLKPKMGLQAMAFYLMNLRLQMRFAVGPNKGKDATYAVISLTAEDAEILEDISDTLDFFYMERLKARKGRYK